MRKKRLWFTLLVVPALLALGALEAETRVVRGYLAGEAFYRGRPTSWWRREVRGWSWRLMQVYDDRTRLEAWWVRSPSFWERWVGRRAPTTDGPPFLDGDPAALGVLIELLHDDYQETRFLAARGLQQLGPVARPAVPVLVRCLADADEVVRHQAGNALRVIDAAAAQEAGID